jgi:hypothetical protein
MPSGEIRGKGSNTCRPPPNIISMLGAPRPTMSNA